MFAEIDFVLLWICLACLASSQAAPVPTQGPQLYLDIIDVAAVSRMSSQEVEGLAEVQAAEEIKRNIGDSFTSMVSKATAEIRKTDRLVAQASAFIYPASSKTSQQNKEGHEYDDPQQNSWNIKESVMYSLSQAANAITDGVTILKGQLIRGSGALGITLGKVNSVEEDTVGPPGNEVISSTTLWTKEPHTTAVYGARQTSHLNYKRSSTYGATPAAGLSTTPSVSTSYAAYRYPSQLYATAVYGARQTSHFKYKRSSTYDVTPAAVLSTTPSVSISYAAFRYPSQLDGRLKIIGFNAGSFLEPSKSPDYEHIEDMPQELLFRTVNWWK